MKLFFLFSLLLCAAWISAMPPKNQQQTEEVQQEDPDAIEVFSTSEEPKYKNAKSQRFRGAKKKSPSDVASSETSTEKSKPKKKKISLKRFFKPKTSNEKKSDMTNEEVAIPLLDRIPEGESSGTSKKKKKSSKLPFFHKKKKNSEKLNDAANLKDGAEEMQKVDKIPVSKKMAKIFLKKQKEEKHYSTTVFSNDGPAGIETLKPANDDHLNEVQALNRNKELETAESDIIFIRIIGVDKEVFASLQSEMLTEYSTWQESFESERARYDENRRKWTLMDIRPSSRISSYSGNDEPAESSKVDRTSHVDTTVNESAPVSNEEVAATAHDDRISNSGTTSSEHDQGSVQIVKAIVSNDGTSNNASQGSGAAIEPTIHEDGTSNDDTRSESAQGSDAESEAVAHDDTTFNSWDEDLNNPFSKKFGSNKQPPALFPKVVVASSDRVENVPEVRETTSQTDIPLVSSEDVGQEEISVASEPDAQSPVLPLSTEAAGISNLDTATSNNPVVSERDAKALAENAKAEKEKEERRVNEVAENAQQDQAEGAATSMADVDVGKKKKKSFRKKLKQAFKTSNAPKDSASVEKQEKKVKEATKKAKQGQAVGVAPSMAKIDAEKEKKKKIRKKLLRALETSNAQTNYVALDPNLLESALF